MRRFQSLSKNLILLSPLFFYCSMSRWTACTSTFHRIPHSPIQNECRRFYCFKPSCPHRSIPERNNKNCSEDLGTVPPYTPVETNPLIFMDVVVEGDLLGRVIIELFRDVAPKSAEHFRSLCTGERGGCCGGYRSSGNYGDPHHSSRTGIFSETSGNTNTYQGVPFHRIIPGFIVQGGDITTKDGRSNTSLFEFNFPSDFAEVKKTDNLGGAGSSFVSLEKSRIHAPGTVALAHINGNPHENGTQFFLNLSFNSHLNDKFLVVGQVLRGWEVVLGVARSCGSRSGVPVSRSWILACGQSGGYLEEETNAALLQSQDIINKANISRLFPSS